MKSDNLPARILVGPRPVVIERAQAHLKASWCLYDSCGLCGTCKGIGAHRHYLLQWAVPLKQSYTVAQIQEIIRTLSLSLGPGEQFYVVFEFAELLSLSAAHMLLKSLEEPPPGCHFMLLTESIEALLPTIVSRCVVEEVTSAPMLDQWASFLYFFCQPTKADGHSFQRECERALPPEFEARKLIESLIAYWLEQARSQQGAQHAYARVALLEQALSALPMPGSSRHFWRTLFLRLNYGLR